MACINLIVFDDGAEPILIAQLALSLRLSGSLRVPVQSMDLRVPKACCKALLAVFFLLVCSISSETEGREGFLSLCGNLPSLIKLMAVVKVQATVRLRHIPPGSV